MKYSRVLYKAKVIKRLFLPEEKIEISRYSRKSERCDVIVIRKHRWRDPDFGLGAKLVNLNNPVETRILPPWENIVVANLEDMIGKEVSEVDTIFERLPYNTPFDSFPGTGSWDVAWKFLIS